MRGAACARRAHGDGAGAVGRARRQGRAAGARRVRVGHRAVAAHDAVGPARPVRRRTTSSSCGSSRSRATASRTAPGSTSAPTCRARSRRSRRGRRERARTGRACSARARGCGARRSASSAARRRGRRAGRRAESRRRTRATCSRCARGRRCAAWHGRRCATRGCGWSSSASRPTRGPTRAARRPRSPSPATSSTRSARGTCAAGCTRSCARSCGGWGRWAASCVSDAGVGIRRAAGRVVASTPTGSASSARRSSAPRRGAMVATCAGAAPVLRPQRRTSLSGFALMLGVRGRDPSRAHHTIHFPADYDAEFDDVFVHRRPARSDALRWRDVGQRPCRGAVDGENSFVLVNAPTDGADWDWSRRRLRGAASRAARAAWTSATGSPPARGARPPTWRETGAPAVRSTATRPTAGSAHCGGRPVPARAEGPLPRRRDDASRRRPAARDARRDALARDIGASPSHVPSAP